MKSSLLRSYCLLLILALGSIALLPSLAQAASQSDVNAGASASSQGSQWIPPNGWFIYFIIIIVFLVSIVALLLVRQALGRTTWSLSDALSEEVEITATEVVNGVKKPLLDPNGKPLQIAEMRASSSRLIALMGMIAILVVFLGFGTFALYGFAKTGNLPSSIDRVIKFLVAGLTLFAPYVVNKFSSMFGDLTSSK